MSKFAKLSGSPRWLSQTLYFGHYFFCYFPIVYTCIPHSLQTSTIIASFTTRNVLCLIAVLLQVRDEDKTRLNMLTHELDMNYNLKGLGIEVRSKATLIFEMVVVDR